MEHADAELFVGRCVVVTPVEGSDPTACARVEAFWRQLGAFVVRRDPEAHDVQVAWTSPLPHLLAYAFAHAIGRAPAPSSELAASGFVDFTRIAHSAPDLWADILTTNGKALVGPLEHFSESLSALARAAEAGDTNALERLLASARDTLAQVATQAPATRVAPLSEDARSGGTNPEIQAAPEPESGDPREVTNQHE